jgi:hypothetical protein
LPGGIGRRKARLNVPRNAVGSKEGARRKGFDLDPGRFRLRVSPTRREREASK